MFTHILGSRMAQRDSGVDRLTSQQQTNGTADGDATAQHAHLLAIQIDVVGAQQLDHAARRAWQRRGNVSSGMQHKFAEIIRMHPVGVLLGIDQIDDGVLVDSPWQGQLHDISGTGGIRIELADCIDDLIERRILRQLALDGIHADFGAIGMFAGDIFHGAGV